MRKINRLYTFLRNTPSEEGEPINLNNTIFEADKTINAEIWEQLPLDAREILCHYGYRPDSQPK